MKNKTNPLDFTGCVTVTSDTYYDIMNGYYSKEIKDQQTKTELKKAIAVISALANYLEENELVA